MSDIRFKLSLQDVEDLSAERGVAVFYTSDNILQLLPCERES